MNIGNNEVPIGIKPPHIDVGQGQVPSGVKPPEVNTGNMKTPICPPHPGIDIGCHKVPAGVRPAHQLQLDTTLTKPGYAADAAAVGNLFGKLNAPVYIVYPGSTKFQDIENASQKEKLVVIYQDGRTYFLSDLNDDYAVFTTVYTNNGETYTQNIVVNSGNQWDTEDPISTTSQEEVINLIQQALDQIDIVNGNVW